MVVWNLPAEWTPWMALLAHHLHARLAWRLAPLLLGMLFARGRRTVASWLRAAGIRRGFPGYYYFLGSLGRRTEAIAGSLLRLALERLGVGARLLFALDDTPTPRYGRKVQGAGIHHNPTPGPTDQKFLYGHLWVTLAWVVRHPRWGILGLPLLALLYVRQKDIATIPRRYGWSFETKLELAVRLVQWLVGWAQFVGKALWVVVDGGYAKAPFLKPALAAGVVLVGRLRKDAALRDVPSPLRPGQRRGPGRPRTYGAHRISLAKRAGQKRGWQTVEAVLYGERVQKSIKTFLATWPSVGGVLRVVIVQEEDGWLPFFCTDVNATATEVLETVAARSSIEQDFHDLKEVHGAGQQQLRNYWANIAAYHLTMWLHTLIELWAWHKPKKVLVDRSASLWDDASRRPSHADRRNALRRECLTTEFQRETAAAGLSRQMLRLCKRLLKLAA
jgi:DDE superfamily endonuclease